MPEQKRLPELPILSAFLCLFVVMGHLGSEPLTTLPVGGRWHLLFFVANKLLSLAVPTFVFISGMRLTTVYWERPPQALPFLKKRLLRILPLYVVWYIAHWFLLRGLDFVVPETPLAIFRSFWIGDLVSPFYFIPMILQCYIIFFPMLAFLRMASVRSRWMALAVTAVLTVLYAEFFSFPYQDRVLPTYFIYFFLGGCMACSREELRAFLKKRAWCISAVFAAFFAWHSYHAYAWVRWQIPYGHWQGATVVFSLLGILFLYYIAIRMEKVLPRVFSYIDRGGLTIFLGHCFFVYWGNSIWQERAGLSILDRFFLNTIFVLTSIFLIWVVQDWVGKKLRAIAQRSNLQL